MEKGVCVSVTGLTLREKVLKKQTRFQMDLAYVLHEWKKLCGESVGNFPIEKLAKLYEDQRRIRIQLQLLDTLLGEDLT